MFFQGSRLKTASTCHRQRVRLQEDGADGAKDLELLLTLRRAEKQPLLAHEVPIHRFKQEYHNILMNDLKCDPSKWCD